MKRVLFLTLCLALAAVFGALGVWQVQRLGWKRALIERVEARLAAAPVPPPAASAWSPGQAYMRVETGGVFLHEAETLVQALTERGAGWWVMTPLRTDDGRVILVNRGFVPSERRDPAARVDGNPPGRVTLQGLLRASEPPTVLRANAPAAGRWYSRDVPAIAAARRIAGPVAPYFIDADDTRNPGGHPVGGLTVVAFRNDHLIYALTWFGLTGLSLFSAALVARRGRSS